jgi:hypothetical protein
LYDTEVVGAEPAPDRNMHSRRDRGPVRNDARGTGVVS